MTIEQFLDEHREEMLEDIKTLVRIPSTREEPQPGKPFGAGPARVLEAARKMMEGYGLHTKNYENYVVTGDFNEKEKQLDILAHLDVVPVTENWTVTQPFEPKLVNGRLYGRGTADDKGPAVAALYALRAIKECGIELKKNVRLILGSDEECGSGDLAYYYGIESEAPMSFTPDADFPVVNIEKGRLAKEFTAEFAPAESGVREFHGGDKGNVVPANARAVVAGASRKAAEEAIEHGPAGVAFTLREIPEGLEITAQGLAAHASTPQNGKNAVCALLALFSALPLADSGQTRTFCALSRLFPFGDNEGKALGVAMEDEISGNLTMNLGILHFDGQTLSGNFDSRVPICGSDETVTDVIRQKLQACGITLEEGKMTPPHHVPADGPFVSTLLSCYEKYSGKKGKAIAIGGGTYVHDLKHGVAFGCMSEETDNHMHGDDEFVLTDVLIMSAKIFADVICRLCG